MNKHRRVELITVAPNGERAECPTLPEISTAIAYAAAAAHVSERHVWWMLDNCGRFPIGGCDALTLVDLSNADGAAWLSKNYPEAAT